ncbi:MAG TPA: hypothetical protein VIX20_07485 [Ktedonobacteraceae bacterium]
MDQIEITIKHESIDGEAMFVVVQINGNDMPGILNVEAFFAIKQENELVPLFTCGCGDFGCGGYYVNISCNETGLILRNCHHRYIYSLPSEFEYQLEWQQVRSIAEEIITYLEKIQKRNPKAYVTTGYGGENLIDYLTDFRQSFLMIPR